jgi:hypothetical protein
LSSWTVLNGPEGRPLDAAKPQLHRVIPPPGVVSSCGGVGMAPLRIRIDMARVDPVWIESGNARDVVPFFGPQFRLDLAGQPRITAPGRLAIADGDIIDPDRGRPGLLVCPMGDTVSFEVAPG